METLQKGDYITNSGLREQVLARLEDLVFIQRVHADGSHSPVSSAMEISDLIAYGWQKEQS